MKKLLLSILFSPLIIHAMANDGIKLQLNIGCDEIKIKQEIIVQNNQKVTIPIQDNENQTIKDIVFTIMASKLQNGYVQMYTQLCQIDNNNKNNIIAKPQFEAQWGQEVAFACDGHDRSYDIRIVASKVNA